MTDSTIQSLVSPHTDTITSIAAEHGAEVESIHFGGGMSRAERNNNHVGRIQLRLAGAGWTEHDRPDDRRKIKEAVRAHLLSVGCGRISVHLLAQ